MSSASASSTSPSATSKDKNVLLTYKGDVYDVTPFLHKHPAGKEILIRHNGQDVTEAFDNEGHSEDACALMLKYKVKAGKKQETEPTKAKATPRAKPSMRKVLSKKLFTKEDKHFIHKTLGLLSLLSFAFRYFWVLPTTGTLGFQSLSIVNVVTILLHTLLSCSSLIFHVLEHRIVKNPLIIYEEYRLHAIVFTLRAIGISVIGMSLHLLPEQVVLPKLAVGGFMFLIHQTVDYITRRFGTPGMTAVRVTNDGRFKMLKLFFSYYQFCAVAAHVTTDPALCDLGWNAVIAIQSSAFLMTLKRKGLVKWTTYAFWYGLALVLSLIYMGLTKGPVFFAVVAVCFYLRITFGISKYYLWAGYAVLYYASSSLLPPQAASIDASSLSSLSSMAVAGMASMAGLGSWSGTTR